MTPAAGATAVVEVEGRRLRLSNLDKVLYPASQTTKAEVIDYYRQVAPVILPHLRGRALTRVRFPDGGTAGSFFEKNAPSHTPEWVATAVVNGVRYIVCNDLATLVWLANQACLELHTHTNLVGAPPDLLVCDLDPGPPAGALECAEAALRIREVLRPIGLEPRVKTSGNKGLQVYASVRGLPEVTHESTSALAKELGDQLGMLTTQRKDLRAGKVLLDWSQNSAAKTTVTCYSLRGRDRPFVSTPVTWAELETARRPEDLAFTAPEVLDRVAGLGDLFAPLAPGPG